MNITITGISGFVGSNLVEYLSGRGMQVHGVSMRDQLWKNGLNGESEAIIHLAGKAHDTQNTADEADYFRVNRDLTIELFDWFLSSNVREFYFFSSVKAAADQVTGALTEDVIPNPQTPYGKSKLAAEQYLLSKDLPAGKRLFIIRPCMIHGPGNKGNLNLLFQVVKKGLPWPLAAFDNRRSFLSIGNLNALLEQMLTRGVPSGVYHFADDQTISTNTVIQIIGRITERPIKLWKIPRKLISFAAKTGDVFGLPLNTERLQKLTENYVVSNQKIKDLLEIEQLPLSAEEGLEITIKSFKS